MTRILRILELPSSKPTSSTVLDFKEYSIPQKGKFDTFSLVCFLDQNHEYLHLVLGSFEESVWIAILRLHCYHLLFWLQNIYFGTVYVQNSIFVQ